MKGIRVETITHNFVDNFYPECVPELDRKVELFLRKNVQELISLVPTESMSVEKMGAHNERVLINRVVTIVYYPY